MISAVETLFYCLEQYHLTDQRKKILYLNARLYPDTEISNWQSQQYFKPFVDVLAAQNIQSTPEIPSFLQEYDCVLIVLPKNMIEAKYLIARGISLLQSGGRLICTADNKAGGTRLKKLFKEFGVEIEGQESRNHARTVWGMSHVPDGGAVANAIQAGEKKTISDGRFVSQAGIFGWNKIDKGSQILTRFLPADLKGKGADFGCGYGFLSDYILSHCPKIKRLHCLDADWRAVQLCQENLGKYDQVEIFVCWRDLTQNQSDLKNLDFIVMNPPFHEGAKQDVEIGQTFIYNAYHALRRGGVLWMVANAHLPYERVLNDIFYKVENIHEETGFKIFKALK